MRGLNLEDKKRIIDKLKQLEDFPEIDWAKDGRLVKEGLKNYSLEEIKGLIDWYLKSEISDKLGIPRRYYGRIRNLGSIVY